MWAKSRITLKTIIFIWCLFLSADTFAYQWEMTPEEARMLPPICQPATRSLHFCHGLKFVMRANRSIGDRKAGAWEFEPRLLVSLSYVLEHPKQDSTSRFYFALASIESAKIYSRLDQNAEAIQMYAQAIKYNPKIPQAYAGLSDIYLDLGQVEEARKVLETGLKQAPKSKSLKRRFENISKK